MGTEATSEGVTWRHTGSFFDGLDVKAFCKKHGVYFLFRHNRTGEVEDLREHHMISREQGYYATSDSNGALFCGEDGGHSAYLSTDPRNYGQARKIAQPLIQARINLARAKVE
jgi:hypothetical protein